MSYSRSKTSTATLTKKRRTLLVADLLAHATPEGLT